MSKHIAIDVIGDGTYHWEGLVTKEEEDLLRKVLSEGTSERYSPIITFSDIFEGPPSPFKKKTYKEYKEEEVINSYIENVETSRNYR